MRKYTKLYVLATASMLTLIILAGCSVKNDTEPSPVASSAETAVSQSPASPNPSKSVTKEYIASALADYGDSAIDITWSPDNSAVVFIRLEETASNICLWRVGADTATLVSVAEPTMDGFSWSPNSKYFLVNVGHMGPGTITSTLFDAESLELISADITSVSISPPAWSSDSRFLALSSWADYNTVEITAFAVASKTTVSLIKATNSFGPYVVEAWGDDNIIKYTEMTSSSDRVEKTIALGE